MTEFDYGSSELCRRPAFSRLEVKGSDLTSPAHSTLTFGGSIQLSNYLPPSILNSTATHDMYNITSSALTTKAP
jgi:hypothetical protein